MPSIKGIGTKKVGYAPSHMGPFRCDKCTWFKSLSFGGACGHPEVLEDRGVEKVKTSEGQKARVDPGGCCNEFRPLTQILDVKFDDVIKVVP